MKNVLIISALFITLVSCAPNKKNTNISCDTSHNTSFGHNLVKAEAIKVKSSKSQYGHQADYLLISCIDFRLVDEIGAFMERRGLKDNYDYLVLAGASLGIKNEKFPHWDKTFFDHLQLVQDLHKVRGVIILDHRNCGLYRALLGKEVEATRSHETNIHREQFLKVRKLIHKKYPEIKVEFLLMDIDGIVI